ncbi:MFS transporter [Agromyces aureus]|uniref:MFS transporter n=1 Tax=Agromyces aureus TaxID=453304 RepID=UPI000A3EF8DD|nr:MFS transporter [Agromyces aureus]
MPDSAPPAPADADASTAPTSGTRRRFVDLAPLRASPAFARLWIGGVISGVGAQLTVLAVGLQVYEITQSTLAVGLVGGIALVPMIVAGLWGGVLADVFDRRRVLITSATVTWAATAGLLILSAADVAVRASGGRVEVWPFYALTTVITVAGTVSGSAHMAVTPRILPPELVSRAAALSGIGAGVQLTLGPALGGVLVATVGFPITFGVDLVLFAFGFLGIFMLPRIAPEGEPRRASIRTLLDGLAFLKQAPNIRAGFVIDLIAMTFGRPYALLPAVGAVAIGGGPVTVGILTAAFAVGTFTTSLLSGPVAHVHRYGVAIGRSVMVYGACIAGFGAVLAVTLLQGGAAPAFTDVNPVALVAAAVLLVGAGASDEVSAIFRSTMLMTAVPDEMLGRMQGVFVVVVAGGPRLGDLWVGVLATSLALWFPPLAGGLLIVALVAVLLRLQPGFRGYDASDPRP